MACPPLKITSVNDFMRTKYSNRKGKGRARVKSPRMDYPPLPLKKASTCLFSSTISKAGIASARAG